MVATTWKSSVTAAQPSLGRYYLSPKRTQSEYKTDDRKGHNNCEVVRSFVGDFPASEFYLPTLRNTLSIPSSEAPMKMEQSVPKRRHIKFRRRGITQKKAYSIQNTAKV